MKILQASAQMQALGSSLVDSGMTPDEVGDVGIVIFCELYGGTENQSLNSLRYIWYQVHDCMLQ